MEKAESYKPSEKQGSTRASEIADNRAEAHNGLEALKRAFLRAKADNEIDEKESATLVKMATPEVRSAMNAQLQGRERKRSGFDFKVGGITQAVRALIAGLMTLTAVPAYADGVKTEKRVEQVEERIDGSEYIENYDDLSPEEKAQVMLTPSKVRNFKDVKRALEILKEHGINSKIKVIQGTFCFIVAEIAHPFARIKDPRQFESKIYFTANDILKERGSSERLGGEALIAEEEMIDRINELDSSGKNRDGGIGYEEYKDLKDRYNRGEKRIPDKWKKGKKQEQQKRVEVKKVDTKTEMLKAEKSLKKEMHSQDNMQQYAGLVVTHLKELIADGRMVDPETFVKAKQAIYFLKQDGWTKEAEEIDRQLQTVSDAINAVEKSPKLEFKFSVTGPKGTMTDKDLIQSGERLKNIVNEQKEYLKSLKGEKLKEAQTDITTLENTYKVFLGLIVSKKLDDVVKNKDEFRDDLEKSTNKIIEHVNSYYSSAFLVSN